MRELHKVTSISQKDVKPWLPKQALWQVHIPQPQEKNHPYCDMPKPNEQHQFDILYVHHSVFEANTYKYILTGVDVASRYKVVRPLRTTKASETAFVLKAIFRRVVCLNTQMWQSCLKNTMTTFEKKQQNLSTLTKLLCKPLTKNWQNNHFNTKLSMIGMSEIYTCLKDKSEIYTKKSSTWRWFIQILTVNSNNSFNQGKWNQKAIDERFATPLKFDFLTLLYILMNLKKI